jgi:hypothetical protein
VKPVLGGRFDGLEDGSVDAGLPEEKSEEDGKDERCNPTADKDIDPEE